MVIFIAFMFLSLCLLSAALTVGKNKNVTHTHIFNTMLSENMFTSAANYYSHHHRVICQQISSCSSSGRMKSSSKHLASCVCVYIHTSKLVFLLYPLPFSALSLYSGHGGNIQTRKQCLVQHLCVNHIKTTIKKTKRKK